MFFSTNLGLGAGALSIGKKSDKTRKIGKIHNTEVKPLNLLSYSTGANNGESGTGAELLVSFSLLSDSDPLFIKVSVS